MQNQSQGVLEQNQLHLELLGIGGNINPFIAHDSSSRIQMFCNHIGQALVLRHSTPKRIFTGAEDDLGKYTFGHRMPCNANIIKVINRIPIKHGYGTIKENPEVCVIFEDVETKEVDCMLIHNYHALHPVFGYKYNFHKNAVSRLTSGQNIAKGTVIADSPAIKENGQYCMGRETNVAYLAIPQVIEDGVVISKSYAKKLAIDSIGKRTISWGKKFYPINLYGDVDNYQPFPQVGQKVRDDGLLMALREFDVASGIVNMTQQATLATSVDYTYDKLTYVTAASDLERVVGAKVIDVEVAHNTAAQVPATPHGMSGQLEFYNNIQHSYYSAILTEYRKLKHRRKAGLKLTHKMHSLIKRALSEVPPTPVRNVPAVQKLYRKAPIDDWLVNITFECAVLPTIGWKVTGSHGNRV